MSALTRTEAAELLGVHPNTVSSWADRGLLEQGSDGSLDAASVERLRNRIFGLEEEACKA